MSGFSIAKHIKETFHTNVRIEFLVDDNAPAETVEKEGLVYTRSLRFSVNDMGMGKDRLFLASYKRLFDYLTEFTGLAVSIRRDTALQMTPQVRTILMRIMEESYIFSEIFSPSDKFLHIKVPCPKCGFAEKTGRTLKWTRINHETLKLETMCFEHGVFTSQLSPTAGDFIDTNTPIADVLQTALFIEEDKEFDTKTILVDGADWSGNWATDILYRGLSKLGYAYEEIPQHFYTPLVLDWSGAKFSKSIYLKTGFYDYLPAELLDFDLFVKTFGYEKLDLLWVDVDSWVTEPKKFFRNYSVDYFCKLLGI